MEHETVIKIVLLFVLALIIVAVVALLLNKYKATAGDTIDSAGGKLQEVINSVDVGK